MIKYIGLLFIFITSVLIGFSLTEQLNNRIIILKSIKAMLQQFKIDITYQMPTVRELFSKNGDNIISELTNKISKNLQNGFTPKESVEKGVDSSACISSLSKEERYFLIEIFSELGTSDVDGQISLLENAVERIDFYIENSIEDKRKNSKVYLTASIYTGIALVIILL